MDSIRWISILLSALIPLVVGFIWYNPKVFGNAWMKESGMTEEKAKQGNMPLIFGLSFFLAFLAAFFLYTNVNFGGSPTDPHGTLATRNFGHGAFHGVFLGILVGIPMLFTNGLFEQKSFRYMAINAGYWIVSFALMGGVVSQWP